MSLFAISHAGTRVARSARMIARRTIAAALLVACGGKVSATSGGDADSHTPSGPTPPAATTGPSLPAPPPGPRPPPHVQCGGQAFCEGDQPVCCIGDHGASCRASTATSGCSMIVECQASSDCGTGERCCASDFDSPVQTYACLATTRCPFEEACNRDADCTRGICLEDAFQQTNISICGDP